MSATPDPTNVKFPASPPPYTESSRDIPPPNTIPTLQPPIVHPIQATSPHPSAHYPRPYPQYQRPQEQFGPTPITTTQLVLPYAYYGNRDDADVRARWRFVGALMCAFGLWLALGFCVGVEIWGDAGTWGLTSLRWWVWMVVKGGAVA